MQTQPLVMYLYNQITHCHKQCVTVSGYKETVFENLYIWASYWYSVNGVFVANANINDGIV